MNMTVLPSAWIVRTSHRDEREHEGDAILFAKKAAPGRDDTATNESSAEPCLQDV